MADRKSASKRRRRFRAGSQLSDDEIEEEEKSDDADADVNHEAAVASARADHVVQTDDRASEQAVDRK